MPHLTDTVLPPQDIMLEVRKFISGTARTSQSSNTLELTRTALGLLKNVPATREAVLEYFCSVFFAAVKKHVRQIEVSYFFFTFQFVFFSIINFIQFRILQTRQNVPISEENIISEIHLVLSSFINGSPEAWAPIISAWSLDLLGEPSVKKHHLY